jgi:ParB/RepB/Spo0J family partition protein
VSTETLPPIILISIDKIKVPKDRQRQKAEADDALIQSIDRRGLFHPIILHKDLSLVAGERRLDAFKKLKHTEIPARIFEQLPPLARFEAELQENIARKQLTWQEEVLAVGRYHEMRKKDYGGWTQMGTAEALGFSRQHIGYILTVFEERADADVMASATLKGAFNLVSSRAERATIAAHNRGLVQIEAIHKLSPSLNPNATPAERTAALLASIKTEDLAAETVEDIDKKLKAVKEGREAKALLDANARLEVASDLLINADFLEWAEGYSGPKFDVLHLDFPWGKNYSGARTRRTGAHICPTYADHPEIYFSLIEGFLNLQDQFAFPAAHCICWFDHIYYAWTIEQFEKAGWQLVQPHPFIWTKGYQGIAADVKRRPRHCYEAALLFVRGDRKIVKLDKDWFDCPVDEKLHMNQKPMPMLKHLLGIFVDEHTAVLDPTCGSGSSLVAARLLGSQRVLGIELDSDNADIAKFMLQRALATTPEEKLDE